VTNSNVVYNGDIQDCRLVMRWMIGQSIVGEEKPGNQNVFILERNSLVPDLLGLTDELYLIWDAQRETSSKRKDVVSP